MNLEEAEKTYIEKGIAVIPGVFSKEETDKMRGASLVAMTRPNNKYKHTYIEYKNDNYPALMFWPALTHSYLNEVRCDPRVQQIVKHFLGDNVKQLNNQIYFRLPGDRDEFAWHQDICFRQPRERYSSNESDYLQLIVAIDDITLENAPIEFIPGSHTKGEWDLDTQHGIACMTREFNRMGLEGQKYTCKAGDVMIWTYLTVHGSESNGSARSRMYYMSGFAKASAAQDWPFYLNNGQVVKEINYSAIP